jgi:hypothetical protein
VFGFRESWTICGFEIGDTSGPTGRSTGWERERARRRLSATFSARHADVFRRKRRFGSSWKDCAGKRALRLCAAERVWPRISTAGGRSGSGRPGEVASGAGACDRTLRRALQPPALPRVTRRRDSSRCISGAAAGDLDPPRNDQEENNGSSFQSHVYHPNDCRSIIPSLAKTLPRGNAGHYRSGFLSTWATPRQLEGGSRHERPICAGTFPSLGWLRG